MYIYDAKTKKMKESKHKNGKIRNFIEDMRFKITMRKVLKRIYKEERNIV